MQRERHAIDAGKWYAKEWLGDASDFNFIGHLRLGESSFAFCPRKLFLRFKNSVSVHKFLRIFADGNVAIVFCDIEVVLHCYYF